MTALSVAAGDRLGTGPAAFEIRMRPDRDVIYVKRFPIGTVPAPGFFTGEDV